MFDIFLTLFIVSLADVVDMMYKSPSNTPRTRDDLLQCKFIFIQEFPFYMYAQDHGKLLW